MTICVYQLADEHGRGYTGCTVDLARRLRQHNGELRGGARSTRGRTWRVVRTWEGFAHLREAMSYEWHLKRRHHRILAARWPHVAERRVDNKEAAC